jgi:hypothetical protein
MAGSPDPEKDTADDRDALNVFSACASESRVLPLSGAK